MTESPAQEGRQGPPDIIILSCSLCSHRSHLIFGISLQVLGEGEGVGQAGHLVVTGGYEGRVTGLGGGVTAAKCVMGRLSHIESHYKQADLPLLP